MREGARRTRVGRWIGSVAVAALAFAAASPAAADVLGVCPAPPQPEVEPNGTPATATVLTPGFFGLDRAPGSIGAPGDVDYFRVSFTSPTRLTVLVDTAVLPQNPGSTTRDSVVQVLAGNGTTILEQDDDDGTGLAFGPVVSGEASAIVGLPVSGTVHIRVTAKDPGAVLSPYVLWIAFNSTPFLTEVEPNDTPATAMWLDPPAVMGSLSGASDLDWYRRVLLGGGPHMILVDGDPERDGTTTDVRIDFEPGATAPPPINSSVGAGSPPPGSEALYMGTYAWLAPAFRLSGPAAGTYSVSLAYIGGDACNVPVQLQSFEVR